MMNAVEAVQAPRQLNFSLPSLNSAIVDSR